MTIKYLFAMPWLPGIAPTLLWFAPALLWFAPALRAETLKDPTRPPMMAPAVSNTLAAPSPTQVLRSIRIDRRGNVAMIDGSPVKVGDHVGDARVKVIRPYEVVLAGVAGDRTLRLYPGVDKHAHRMEPGTQAPLARVRRSERAVASGVREP